MNRRRVWVILVVLVLLGAGLRLYKLDEKSLWSDEVATIASAMGNSIDPDAYRLRGEAFDPPGLVPASEYRLKATRSHGAGNFEATARVLEFNVHPPLFFFMMNLWLHAFGLGEAAMRMPAVLFGMFCIPMAFLAGRRLWPEEGERFGLLAAALVAVSAYQVSHAQDARQYTLLVFLALAAIWFALRLVQSGRPAGRFADWLGLVLCLAAGMYSQYFFANFVLFVYGWLAWQKRRQPVFLKAMALSLGGLALLGLPWLPHFSRQLVFVKAVGHYTAGLWNPLQLPEKLWRIFSEFLLQDSRPGRVLPLLIFGMAAWPWLRAWRQARQSGDRSPAWPPVLGMLLLWMLAVAGGQILIDLLKQSHTATIRRYMLLASPAFYFLIAYALLRVRSPGWRRGLVGLTLGWMLCNAGLMLGSRHRGSDEFKQAAAWIEAQSRPGDVVLVNKSGAIAVGMALYLPETMPMLGLEAQPVSALKEDAPQMRRLEKSLARRSRVWVVYSHAAPSTRNRLRNWFEARRYHQGEEKKVPGVRVLLYEKPSGD